MTDARIDDESRPSSPSAAKIIVFAGGVLTVVECACSLLLRLPWTHSVIIALIVLLLCEPYRKRLIG